MKKNSQEIVSLNDELISFDSDDIGIEALEQRLEMVFLRNFKCLSYGCLAFDGCSGFSCSVFTID